MSRRSETDVSTTPAPTRGPRNAVAFRTTKRRVLTRRGALWLGQTCNLRCFFCYFAHRVADAAHPEHPFMGIEKAKRICKTLRRFYGNTAVDIQGGEPTLYPDILELVRYCREIGLYPTLITNGLALSKPGLVERYREAGVRDFLVSLHGIGAVHDEVVGREGAYAKTIAAIELIHQAGVPLRFNCTMTKPVVPFLVEIAEKAIGYGAYGVNYIAHNDFVDQRSGVRTTETVPRYSELAPGLGGAIDLLEGAGIETNVRYVPLCIAQERHRKNFYNFQQLSYDLHEWDYQSWLWTMMQPQMMRDGDLTPPYRLGPGARKYVWWSDHLRLRDWCGAHPVMCRLGFVAQRLVADGAQLIRGKRVLYRQEAVARARDDLKYTYGAACQRCGLKGICDGFHGDYARMFGMDEARAATDVPPTEDPTFHIRRQEKVVEPEDESWAL